MPQTNSRIDLFPNKAEVKVTVTVQCQVRTAGQAVDSDSHLDRLKRNRSNPSIRAEKASRASKAISPSAEAQRSDCNLPGALGVILCSYVAAIILFSYFQSPSAASPIKLTRTSACRDLLESA